MGKRNIGMGDKKVADALARIVGVGVSSVLSKQEICSMLERGLMTINYLKELARLERCDIDRRDLFMLDVVNHTKHYHHKIYISEVSGLLIIMDGSTGLIYRVNLRNFKYEVTSMGILSMGLLDLYYVYTVLYKVLMHII